MQFQPMASDNDLSYYECRDDEDWNNLKNNQMNRPDMQIYVSGCYSTT